MHKVSLITHLIEKPIPLRPRYFVTKNNLPRLRYVSLLSAAALVSIISLSNGKNLMANNPAEDIAYMMEQTTPAGGDRLTTNMQAGLLQNIAYQNGDVKPAEPSAEAREAYNKLQDTLKGDIVEKVASLGKNASDALNILKNNAEAEKPTAPVKPTATHVTLKKGDTLTGLLRRQGIGASEAYRAVEALSKYYDPRSMKPGLTVELKFGEDRVVDGDTYKTIAMLDVPFDKIKSARVVLDDQGKFKAAKHEKAIIYTDKSGAFDVEVSLFGSAEKANVPHSIVAEAMRIYSWNVDFQRDLRKGDRLEVLYREATIEETGEPAGEKDILYANLVLSGKPTPIYRMEMKDGRIDYFQEDGRSIRKALMKTPINGGRLSSGYGMRHHPVLGYNKMHKGIDFAAPTGTKIYAAGDGVIEYIGRNGGYGNYIRIRHNSNLKTAYAHMSRFEKGLSRGDRVKQGQVIGRVGSTGRSTGPHLHHEVLVDGRQVNPRSVKLPTGEKLKGEMLTAFQREVKKYQTRYAMLHDQVRVADASSKTANSDFNE